ncbi:hypothetical protein [Neorhodopirellula pilleata]|uniref:Uncharacterized protein n=1 Tax=Neorhodopirellula pilleata TaxID=2714738 RepID=A0A5C6A529_9BACT|nr:hypothetical protein [Neorhodopirellula pilleata]TWT93493.1 hypothetical protein Pla100_40100 [Neorhodopirellula pilleata]
MTSLRPKNDAENLGAEEVVRRATAEFGFVQCDNDRGVRYAAKDLAQRSDMTHEAKDQAMVPLMDAVEMIVGNDRRSDKHFLKCVVIPNGPIHVLYLYNSHETQTRALLERLANVLGYFISSE